MGSERPRRALLVGLVEVRQPLKQLDEEDRAKMFALCHTASVTGHVEDSGWLGWQERGLMGVEVVLDQEHLHVTSNEVLVSRHSLAEVDAIVAVQGTEGHLVVVGQCQVKGLPLAVVLDMMSHVDARRLEDDVRQRVSRLLPPSVQPSTSKNTVCPPPLPSAPPITDLDLSTSLPYTTCRSVSQHPDQASVHASGSPGPTRIESPSTVVQPSSCSSDLSSPSPLPVKSILTGNFRAKPSVTHMPAPTTLMVTPLRCTFRPPVSHLSISPVSTLPVPNPLVFTPPVSTLPVSTPLVSLRPVSTRPVSTRPVSTPPVPTIPVSNPSMFPRPVSTPPVSALPVSIRPVITWPASTRPASTPPVSTPPVSTQLVSITIVPTSPVSTRPLSKPVLPIRPVSTLTVNSRPVSLSRVSTPLVSTLPVSITSASIPTVSRLPASTPHVPTRPVSFPRVITPLVFTPTVSNTTVSATPVCTPPVSTRPTFTRPVSKPIVPTRPVSFPKVLSSPVSTTPVSIAAVSTTPVSIAAVSTTPMSIAAVSTTPVSIAAVSTTPVSTVVVSTTPVSIAPVCATSVSIAPVPTTPVSIATMSDTPVSTTPVSIAEVSTTPASIAPVSNAPMSNTAVSTIPVSTTPVSTTPMSTTSVSTVPISTTSVATTPVPTTPVSTPWVSNQSASTVMVSSSLLSTPLVNAVSPSTLPVSSPPVSTVPAAPQHLRRHSGESSGSLEEDNSNVHEKVEFILGTLNVDESEYLFTPGMKHKQEQDSSSSMEHELSTFLENEHQYLDTLRRIKDARRVVKSELQNLLRRNESLADFHEDLFRDLHQEFPSCSGVARMFLSRKEDLEQYRYYLMNAPQVIHQLGKQTEEVTRQHPTLEEDLKSSWKRLHYYFMTFDKLAKIASTEEQPLVQEVVELLRDMNRQGDSAILIDGVVGAPFSLHTLGSLLLHGLFTIKDSSGVLKTRAKHHVLLFVEMIVITLPKKERYQYKDHLPIRQLNLREANSDEATFVLEFLQGGNKKNRRFTFKSRQQEATDAWVKEITRLHLEYAKEVKRHSKLRYGWQ